MKYEENDNLVFISDLFFLIEPNVNKDDKEEETISSSDLSQHCRASSNRIVKKCNIVIVSSLNIVERSSIFQMIRLNRLF